MTRTFQRLFAGASTETGVRRELEHHLELLEADYLRSGLARGEARRRAFVALGGVAQIAEQCRDIRWYAGLLRASRVLIQASRGR
jgi:hypothetical protein